MPPKPPGSTDDFADEEGHKTSVDPLDFVADAPSEPDSASGTDIVQLPWDDGPADTTVVTVKSTPDAFDPVAAPTPPPAIAPQEIFGRGAAELSTDLELTGTTGDLTTLEALKFGDGSEEALLKGARDRFALHDFAGVLELLDDELVVAAGFVEADPAERQHLVAVFEADRRAALALPEKCRADLRALVLEREIEMAGRGACRA